MLRLIVGTWQRVAETKPQQQPETPFTNMDQL